MKPAALGPKRNGEQHFVMEEFADPVTVELLTFTQHNVSLKEVIKWMVHVGGKSPEETAMKARVRKGWSGLVRFYRQAGVTNHRQQN
jgi:hypothetical protein